MFTTARGGPYLCTATYSTEDLTSYANELVDLVLAAQELSSKHRFIAVNGVDRSRKGVRHFNPTERGLARLREEIVAGRITGLKGFEEYEIEEHRVMWGGVTLQIDITLAVDFPERVNTCIFLLNSDFLSETADSLHRYVDFSKRVFLATRSLYGYVTVGSSPQRLWSVAWGDSRGVGQEEENEVLGWQMRERMIKTFVRGVYWGNFLNPNHVRTLKGIDNIRENLDFCRVQEIGDGSILILLSEDPLQILSEGLQDRLEKLRLFLQPITLPPYERPKLGEPEIERGDREYLERRVAPEGVRDRNLEMIYRLKKGKPSINERLLYRRPAMEGLSFSVALPSGWKYDDESDEYVVTFYREKDGRGALQISALGRRKGKVDIEKWDAELELREFVKKDYRSIEAPIETYSKNNCKIAVCEFVDPSEKTFWMMMVVGTETRRAFITYTCNERYRDVEIEEVKEIIDSFEFR